MGKLKSSFPKSTKATGCACKVFSSKTRLSSHGSHDVVLEGIRSAFLNIFLHTLTFQVGSTMTHNAPVAIYLAMIERENIIALAYKHTRRARIHSLAAAAADIYV
jgi:hypothetical protein